MSCIEPKEAANPTCNHASENVIKQISVNISNIPVPQYFIGTIPPEKKNIYEVLGIKFVHVVAANGTNYYIFGRCLEQVVQELALFA